MHMGMWTMYHLISITLGRVTGQAEPAPRDPRGGGFDPGDTAAFAAASAPSLPGVPQGQSGFASRGG